MSFTPKRANIFRAAVEVAFWLAIALILVPRVALEFAEKRLNTLVQEQPLTTDWVLSAPDTDDQNITIPNDLRTLTPDVTSWKLTKIVEMDELTRHERPALILGRIGDSDHATINGCLVGSTGLHSDNSQKGYWWSTLRLYEIPSRCLSGPTAKIEISIYKWWGSGFGVIGGPVGIASIEQVKPLADRVEVLRFGTLLLFGIVLILIAVYYAFVYFLVPVRSYNGVFAITAAVIGLFEILTSTFPFRDSRATTALYIVLLFAAAASAVFVVRFLQSRLSVFSPWLVRGFSAVSGLAVLVAIVVPNPKVSYSAYLIWQVLFLLTFLYAYYEYIRTWLKKRDPVLFQYGLGFSVLIFSCIHDVAITRLGIAKPYLIPYGFMTFGIVTALVLAKEYADAFLRVEQQVSDRTSDLAVANEELRALEKMKAKFFANVSHDFKTPIAVAFANIEQAKNGLAQHEQKPLTAAETALNRLQGMVADLLDLTRAESGTLKPKWSRAFLGEAIEMWSKPYEILCQKKGLYLQVMNRFKGIRVPFDPEKLERAFANLVSNAIKFTKEGGITIQVHDNEAQVFIQITDTGPGIPKAEREKIFERFVQGFNTTLEDHGGSGIGLSFVREVTSLHNGRVWVEGEEGRGATFTIAIPLDQDVEITGKYEVSEKEIRLVPPKGSEEVPYPRTEPENVDPKKPSVLSIEDNSEIAQILLQALEPVYNVFCAQNGRIGLDLLSDIAVDCILCDVMMPEMDGTEFLKAIRSKTAYQATPVIMVTSKGEDDDVILHLGLGAQDYVTKPFKRDVLLARVGSQVETLRLRSRLLSADKMVTLGLLSAGIAHEVKNPLLAALNNVTGAKMILDKSAGIISDDATEAEEAKTYLKKKKEMLDQAFEIATRAIGRIENLVKAMGAYSTGSKERTEINISEAIDQALTMVEHKRKTTGVTINRNENREIKVLGYASLNQTFVNLFANAIDAIEGEGGEIHIRTSSTDGKVHIEIEDNGSGIAPDHLAKIFDPFMTTKPAGQGTGLGLFVTKNVIEIQHGGKISVGSHLQKGTTFVIEVPKEAPEGASGTTAFHGVDMTLD